LIQDSLDEQVDETNYHKTEVLKVVNLIKTGDLTPQDRARMKDEYSQEEAFKKAKEEGLQLGEARGLEKGREEGIEQGKLEIAKNMLAQQFV
jgi:predicted transposase/invertase (TIGR01784 family)